MNYVNINIATGAPTFTAWIAVDKDLPVPSEGCILVPKPEGISDTDILTKYVYINDTWIPRPDNIPRFYIYDATTSTWSDPRPLSVIKDLKRAELKTARNTEEFGTFTWDGSTFDANTASQIRINNAMLLATNNPAYTVNWTLADNTTRTLSAQDILAVGLALAQHTDATFVKSQNLQQQVDAAQTKEEVEAITW